MINVFDLVALEMHNRGVSKYDVKLVQEEIRTPYQRIPLDKYVYMLCSQSVDTQALPTRIDLQSPDNFFQFTKTTLENTDVAQYQFFSEELVINVANFGSDRTLDFIPFTIEFMKITPLEYYDHKDEKKN